MLKIDYQKSVAPSNKKIKETKMEKIDEDDDDG